jgi:hypothetical protein
MFADVLRVEGWRNKLNALFAPPAWAAAYHAQNTCNAQLAQAGETGGAPGGVSGHASEEAI